MKRIPIQRDGLTVGELCVEADAAGAVYQARCHGSDLSTLWVVGTDGELRLGVPSPTSAGQLGLRRRFSASLTGPVGVPLRGELRACNPCTEPEDWHPMERLPFPSPYLQRELCNRRDVLIRREQRLYAIALPYNPRQPFPLTQLFCFACIRDIRGSTYAVFSFNRKGCPAFPEGC